MMDYLVFAFWLIPIVLGYFFGRAAEAKHYKSINEREKYWLRLPATTVRTVLDPKREIEHSELVLGSVVVSIDYFKRAVATLRSLVGGAVTSHETLLDRARREAVLRLKQSCPGAHEIINLRLDTSLISDKMPNSVAGVEVMAYGTAIYFRKD
jgi:uncharacterized protein YbjQ (UPF0145 family)